MKYKEIRKQKRTEERFQNSRAHIRIIDSTHITQHTTVSNCLSPHSNSLLSLSLSLPLSLSLSLSFSPSLSLTQESHQLTTVTHSECEGVRPLPKCCELFEQIFVESNHTYREGKGGGTQRKKGEGTEREGKGGGR